MERYKYAGKKMKIKKGVGIITPGEKAEGLIFEAEDTNILKELYNQMPKWK